MEQTEDNVYPYPPSLCIDSLTRWMSRKNLSYCTVRDVQRSRIPALKHLNAIGILELFQDAERLGYGSIEGKTFLLKGATLPAKKPPYRASIVTRKPVVKKQSVQADNHLQRKEWVYFILSPVVGAVKIGVSSRPMDRLSELQNFNPDRLELLCLIPGGTRIEQRYHERFANYRLRGEWFRLQGELRDLVELMSIDR